ncbi:MAG: hypothetical protein H7839_02485 [Magnetococcus sp. YQC-5]
MSDEKMVRYTAQELQAKLDRGEDATDWDRVDAMIASDAIMTDEDAPEVTPDMLCRLRQFGAGFMEAGLASRLSVIALYLYQSPALWHI